MADDSMSSADLGQPMIYEIRVKGQLGRDWAEWFDGLTITPQENGDTLLTGRVTDQAALHGLLKRVRDLGMPLLSVSSSHPGREAPTDVE